MLSRSVRLIAYYLPQFHPVPENDEWRRAGFTEWTNVAKAKPLFAGHFQPNIPADLGFYDLRVPETRAAQADLAKRCGVEGFCYWHYWFGNGRRILERPFEEVLSSGEPDFPFCLGWANHHWTDIWKGTTKRILIEQQYPGVKDYKEHFFEMLPAFTDDRYITIHGKPLFVVFLPRGLPNALEFTDTWRQLARETGLEGLYLVGIISSGWSQWNPREHGFDASTFTNSLQPAFSAARSRLYFTSGRTARRIEKAVRRRIENAVRQTIASSRAEQMISRRPARIEYSEALKHTITDLSSEFLQFPAVIPNWDNTPRIGRGGLVITNSTPRLFQEHIRQVFDQVRHREREEQIVFLKSWNEWAEGNYIEPDQRFGRGYSEVLGSELLG